MLVLNPFQGVLRGTENNNILETRVGNCFPSSNLRRVTVDCCNKLSLTNYEMADDEGNEVGGTKVSKAYAIFNPS